MLPQADQPSQAVVRWNSDRAVDDVQKARGDDFLGRFREVIADPLNLLIDRVPQAGLVRDGLVCLHNGLWVPVEGDQAYYGRFSELLIINRGVHEPLEEFVFQSMLPTLPSSPCMLELGAYWGHYSMWLQQVRPAAQLHLVEPDAQRLETGKCNFARNGFNGVFNEAFVGRGRFLVDDYMESAGIDHLDVLHADIQGFEVEMLEGAHKTLTGGRAARLFISTHSQALHMQVVDWLTAAGLRIDVSADFAAQTTSFDGFVYATHPDLAPLLPDWHPMGRSAIVHSSPAELLAYVRAGNPC